MHSSIGSHALTPHSLYSPPPLRLSLSLFHAPMRHHRAREREKERERERAREREREREIEREGGRERERERKREREREREIEIERERERKSERERESRALVSCVIYLHSFRQGRDHNSRWRTGAHTRRNAALRRRSLCPLAHSRGCFCHLARVMLVAHKHFQGNPAVLSRGIDELDCGSDAGD